MVKKREDKKFEVIDGQQRLTTLGILLRKYEKNERKSTVV